MAIGDPYVTEEDLGLFLKMTVAGNEPELDTAARAASRWVEGWCRRQFNLTAEAEARYFNARNPRTVLVDDIGALTDLEIATDTALDGTYATSWLSTDFQPTPLGAISQGRPVDSLVAVGSYLFPEYNAYRTGLVKVTAVWGWPSVPEDVKQATLIQAARLYKRRESAEGVLGFGEFGPVRVGARVDPDVEDLLAAYRLAPAMV